jgi:hypothetical protein
MIKQLFFAAILLLASVANADDSFLCISDHAVGFHYDKKKGTWETANFQTDDKYVIKKTSANENGLIKDGPISVWEFGNNLFPDFECNSFDENGWLVGCKSPAYGDFRFNRVTMRFQIYTPGSYVGAPLLAEKDAEEVWGISMKVFAFDSVSVILGNCQSI